MKKIQLTISKPCHENWDEMTQEAKGKFCGSCQKTVIDFTDMSDRQLAEFFKKPSGSVCGRFYNDQLNKEIIIPKKRIPWVKYFFQFTWPAWMLTLKSCGDKSRGDTMGEPMMLSTIEQPLKPPPIKETEKDNCYITQGIILTEFAPVDTIKDDGNLPPTPNFIKGDIVVESSTKHLMGDTLLMLVIKPEKDTAAVEGKLHLDTLYLKETTSNRTRYTMGGLAVITCIKDKDKTDNTSGPSVNKPFLPKLTAYPNPIKAGNQLTVSFSSEDDLAESIQLLSASGAIISVFKTNAVDKTGIYKLAIPSNLSEGIYFLQIINTKKQVQALKIMVVN